MAYIDREAAIQRLMAPKPDSPDLTPFCLCLGDRIDVQRFLEFCPDADVSPVVRCRECKWYDPAHIRLNDGTRGEYRDYQPNDILEVGFVTVDIGINVAGRCVRETYIDSLYRKPDDFCSRGEKKEGAENG